MAGISFIKDKGIWYGFVTEYRDRNARIRRLAYENGINNAPQITGINIGNDVSRRFISGISLTKEGESVYAFVQSWQNGNLFRLDFEDGIENNPTWNNLGNLGMPDQSWGLSLIKYQSNWKLFSIKIPGTIYGINFPNLCNASQESSNDVVPSNLSFNSSGEYLIELTAYDEFGNSDDTTQFITVTENQAPIVDFQLSSQCIGSTSTVSALADQTLSSADWIINSEARSGETTTYDFPTPGTYEVTLAVESDNGCGQRLTKEVSIYESPDPEFSLPAGQICTNGAIALNNLTDAKGADADSLITYQWLVDGELVSEEANPSIVFEEGGSKTLRLAASIPGCTETFETMVNVIQGPTVDFALPPQLCAGEVITLENQSGGDDITDYVWSFGDGGTLETLSAEAVEYTFAEAGTYNVALTANTSTGCANIFTQMVTVYEQPTVGFTSDVACAGAVTLFTDTTTAGSNANIIAWNWDFGDGVGISDVRNPSYSYPSAGTYTVSLTTQSSGGCVATSTQEVIVESPVSPVFTANRVCPTESDLFLYRFEDNSTVVEGEIIVQRLWTVNGENFTDEAVTYPFPEAGTYEVSLTAFASSGCNALVSQLVEVRALPQVQFAAPTGCVGEPIALENQSSLNGWEATQYTWNVASVGTVFENSPTVVFSEAGEFPVTLNLETEAGCTFSRDSTIVVQAAPVAAFEVAQLSGGAPLILNPTNLSTDYAQAQWKINDELVSEEAAPSFTLNERGAYELELIVLNEVGCSDTTRQTIEVVNPTLDVAVRELLRLERDGASPQFVLSVENQGTLAVSDLEVLVQLGDVVALTEQIDKVLLPGQSLNYPLQTTLAGVRNQQNPVEYICAAVNIQGEEAGENLNTISELDTSNNRACLTLANALLVETPFPNPADNEVVVSVLLETAELIQLRLISSMGELILAQQLPDAQSGLNTMILDVSQTPTGIYTLEVTAAGQTVSRRVIVQP
ncbi:PKD domain-containing protein [Tunicatimonas pelagia]|uniref:PKD domain-containing protein n=1 Tax=Tunicatimonas pelagia TaxID=931531 RepID=UPI002666B33B|nr:PKD domain-containing protein [Tunicatimonas pelagia]WKN44439.1 PKD domain-containing protein [Tunicatimonas pelagia]